jgi:hypothetical protein
MPSSTSAPALSIVIPAPGDAAALEATLVSVLENRPDDSEVVVATGFDYADPWSIASEVRFVPAPPGSGLAACANVGIAASAAAAVHVLAAGWRATPGWTDGPRELLAADDVTAVVPLVLAADDGDQIVAAGIRLTRGGRRVEVAPPARSMRSGRVDPARIRVAGPLLEAGFWRADVLAAAGPGFTTRCGDWLADADMAAALACLPGRVVVAGDSRVIRGDVRRRPRAFTAGLQAERLFWRSLARGSLPVALLGHAVEIIRDAVATAPLGTLPMLAGRIAGLMQFGDAMPRLVRLRALRQAGADDAGDTLRIDAAHGDLGRPRRQSTAGRPLRKSA